MRPSRVLFIVGSAVVVSSACAGEAVRHAETSSGNTTARCPGGPLSLRVYGSQLDPSWEGKRVTVTAAVALGTRPLGVMLTGTILDRSIELGCDQGLPASMDYPSISIFVDVDGNEACDPTDPAFRSESYGWPRDVVVHLGATDWTSMPGAPALPSTGECPRFGPPPVYDH